MLHSHRVCNPKDSPMGAACCISIGFAAPKGAECCICIGFGAPKGAAWCNFIGLQPQGMEPVVGNPLVGFEVKGSFYSCRTPTGVHTRGERILLSAARFVGAAYAVWAGSLSARPDATCY